MNEHEFILFKEYVAEWIKKDKEIKDQQTKIKQLNDSKDNIKLKIIEFMEKNGINELNTETAGKITLQKTKKRSSITKKGIKQILFDQLDSNIATKIFDELYKTRTVTESSTLKRK